MFKSKGFFFAIAALMGIASAQAAFIVEPRSGGKAFTTNFSANGTPSNSTASATAVGLTPSLGSIFGGTNATNDVYTFSYTPGTNADNTVIAANTILGNGNTATGETGGATGLYNVYVAWPSTTNISDDGATPTSYSITNANTTVVTPVNQDEDTNGSVVGGVWYKVATVTLNAGTTYTVTQTSPNNLFTSMRSSGVMWEAVPAPEPGGMSLLAFGLPMLLKRRRV